jgi:hypothetical protein
MSRMNLAISYLLIITMGILGLWLGSVSVDSGDVRRWIGLMLLLCAVGGLVLVYRRDLRLSAKEKELEWQRIKSMGKVRYVVGQVLLSQLVWLPLLIGRLFEIYKYGTWSSASLPPWWWVVLAALGAPLAFIYSMSWWHRQERKYSDGH